MRWSVPACTLAASVVLANPAIPAGKVWEPLDGSFKERFDTTALIAGGIVMGLRVDIAPDSQRLPAGQRPQLRARVPEAWRNEVICARVASNDGRYEAQMEYRVRGDWETGVAPLGFYTKHDKEVSPMTPDTVAAVVSRGECRDEADLYVPTFWNEPASDPSHGLELKLNSYRASEVYLRVGEGAQATLVEKCEVAKAPRTAFDYRCQLPKNLLDLDGRTRVEVNRIRRRRADQPVEFYIDLSK